MINGEEINFNTVSNCNDSNYNSNNNNNNNNIKKRNFNFSSNSNSNLSNAKPIKNNLLKSSINASTTLKDGNSNDVSSNNISIFEKLEKLKQRAKKVFYLYSQNVKINNENFAKFNANSHINNNNSNSNNNNHHRKIQQY